MIGLFPSDESLGYYQMFLAGQVWQKIMKGSSPLYGDDAPAQQAGVSKAAGAWGSVRRLQPLEDGRGTSQSISKAHNYQAGDRINRLGRGGVTLSFLSVTPPIGF